MALYLPILNFVLFVLGPLILQRLGLDRYDTYKYFVCLG